MNGMNGWNGWNEWMDGMNGINGEGSNNNAISNQQCNYQLENINEKKRMQKEIIEGTIEINEIIHVLVCVYIIKPDEQTS